MQHHPTLNSKTKTIVFKNLDGESMQPLINQNSNLWVIYDDDTRYTIGDLVVYLDDSLLVCHRVICRFPSNRLLLKGDNTRPIDGIYSSHDIIGKVVTVSQNGHKIYLTKGKHRWLKYAFLACSILSIFLPSFFSYTALVKRPFLRYLYDKLIK